MNKLTEPKIPQADEIYDLTIRASFTDKEVRERIEIISEIIQAVKDKKFYIIKDKQMYESTEQMLCDAGYKIAFLSSNPFDTRYVISWATLWEGEKDAKQNANCD